MFQTPLYQICCSGRLLLFFTFVVCYCVRDSFSNTIQVLNMTCYYFLKICSPWWQTYSFARPQFFTFSMTRAINSYCFDIPTDANHVITFHYVRYHPQNGRDMFGTIYQLNLVSSSLINHFAVGQHFTWPVSCETGMMRFFILFSFVYGESQMTN